MRSWPRAQWGLHGSHADGGACASGHRCHQPPLCARHGRQRDACTCARSCGAQGPCSDHLGSRTETCMPHPGGEKTARCTQRPRVQDHSEGGVSSPPTHAHLLRARPPEGPCQRVERPVAELGATCKASSFWGKDGGGPGSEPLRVLAPASLRPAALPPPPAPPPTLSGWGAEYRVPGALESPLNPSLPSPTLGKLGAWNGSGTRRC